jgi:hypothetical protein
MAFKLRVKNVRIATAGVPVVGPDLRTKKVQVVAPATNAGAVYYGSRGLTGRIWRVLAAGATDTHEAPDGGEIDLSALRFDAASSGDKVTLIYYEWEGGAEPDYLIPSEVEGLIGWWKADAITGVSNNAALASWVDSADTLGPLGNATESRRPLYRTNVQNGLPGVLFDGTDDTLEADASTCNHTILIASRMTQGGVLMYLEGNYGLDIVMSGDEELYLISRNDDNKLSYELAAGWLVGSKVVTSKVGLTVADSTLRVNGEVPTPVTVYARKDPGVAEDDALFWMGTHDGDDPMSGYVFEVLFFNVALPLATIEKLENYLNDKWALY